MSFLGRRVNVFHSEKLKSEPENISQVFSKFPTDESSTIKLKFAK